MTEASKPDYELTQGDPGGSSGNVTILTATVPVETEPKLAPASAKRAMELLNSFDFKNNLIARATKEFNLPKGGISPYGGVTPVFKDAATRSGVVAYQRSFKFAQSI